MTILLLLAAQAAQPAPVPGPIKAFGDWTVACDNIRRCEGTSLIPDNRIADDGPWSAVMLSVAREPGPAGGWRVEAMLQIPQRGATSVRVDGAVVASGAPSADSLVFNGADALRIVTAMANGGLLTLRGTRGGDIASVSLAGSSAMLRFIDAEQGRVGTVTAIVAQGAKPASAVPAARPLPGVAQLRPGGTAAIIGKPLADRLFATTGCGENYEADRPPIETAALGGGRTLALVPCGAGAYNFSSVPIILAGGKDDRTRFDLPPGWTAEADGENMLVNAAFDPKTGQLTSYAKGRGIGDCGSSQSYVWDGARFRVVEVRTMGECRGSVNWLATWRARPVMR